ncbi:MAG: ribosome-associated translation inhibitor RaiA [Minisyncoccia bacterium]
MKHNIKAKDISLTPALSEYLEKKLSHLDKFISPEDMEAVMCQVELAKTTRHHKTGNIFEAEYNIYVGGKTLKALKDSFDLYSAIDLANDEMENELRSYKTKKTSLLRRGGAKIKQMLRNIYSR